MPSDKSTEKSYSDPTHELTEYICPKLKSMSPQLIRESLVVGAAFVLLNVLAYLADPTLLASTWFGFGIGILSWVALVMLGVRERKRQDNVLRYWPSWKALMIASAIVILMSTVWQLLLFNVIDSGLVAVLEEAAIENAVSMMEGFGTPESAIEEAVAQMEDGQIREGYAPGRMAINGLIGIAFMGVLNLLFALIVRKEPGMQSSDALDAAI